MGGSCEPNVQAEVADAVEQQHEACAVTAVAAEAMPVAAGQLLVLHPTTA